MSEHPLNVGQRAIIAARLTVNEGYTRDAASVKMDVSRGSYDRARRVLQFGIPEVVLAVENKEASLNWADRVCALSSDRQMEMVTKLKPGFRIKTQFDGVLAPSGNPRPNPTRSDKHNIIGSDVVHRATSNQQALALRLDGNILLDKTITPQEAAKMLTDLKAGAGAYRTLRRLLLYRKEGKS